MIEWSMVNGQWSISSCKNLLHFAMSHYHFLDESGDAGNSEGSSSYLILAFVQLAKNEQLHHLARVRQVLRLKPSFEFKFYRASAAQRHAFFNELSDLVFHVRCVAIDKANMPSLFHVMTPFDLMSELAVRLMMRAASTSIAHDKLIVDGGTPAVCKALRLRFSKAARENNRVPLFSKIVGGDSKRDEGLQLADMIAGAIRMHLFGKDSSAYWLFQTKIVDLWLPHTE